MIAHPPPVTPVPARPPSRADRMTGLVLLGVAIGGLVVLHGHNPTQSSWMPPCVLHALTGLYCPGCGAGRASHQLLHGHLAAAWALNPLYVLTFPYMLYYAVRGFLGLLLGVRLPHIPLGGRRTVWIVPVVVILYMILRNIPVPPFSLLAPHGPGA